MGKKLIIKGANFEENCINDELLIIDRSVYFSFSTAVANKNSSPYADKDYALLQNHRIVSIELKPNSSGTISITKSTALDTGGYEVVGTIDVDSEDIGVFTKYPVNIEVGENDIIGLATPNDTNTFYYDASDTVGIYKQVGTNGSLLSATMGVNWYVK